MLSRRSLILTGSATLVTSLAAPSLALARTSQRRLRMVNYRTNERYDRVFHDGNNYIKDALEEFNWFARDWRRGKAARMSRTTMNIAASLQKKHGNAEQVLISGYRTPATNRSLNGAASKSYHLKGMAMDITMPGVSTSRLYKSAMGIHAGGVGKYTRSNFVHIDSGPFRTWGS